MKSLKNIRNRSRWKNVRGFTLAEMVITVGVFLFVFTGVMVSIQIFGLRIYSLAATKLVATAGGRHALDQIRDEVQEAKTVYVGNCSIYGPSSFTLIGLTNAQAGNALIVYPTTNTTSYTLFYLDTSTATNYLKQCNVTNGVAVLTNTLTGYITNQIVFDAEDYQGNIATNYQSLDNRLVIRVIMQFSQWEYPIAYVGGVGLNAYDYYQLRTRIYRRVWN